MVRFKFTILIFVFYIFHLTFMTCSSFLDFVTEHFLVFHSIFTTGLLTIFNFL